MIHFVPQDCFLFCELWDHGEMRYVALRIDPHILPKYGGLLNRGTYLLMGQGNYTKLISGI